MAVELISIQTGRVATHGRENAADPLDAWWTTAFFKSPVSGPVDVVRDGIVGDEQADRVHHGGDDKAVLCYSADHFADWASVLGVDQIPPGGFGENLTFAGLSEESICLGDRWQIGEVLLEVSQPRQPCWKLGVRWRRPELVRRVVETGRSGWYCRVMTEGQLAAPATADLIARPFPDWTIQRANEVFYSRSARREEARELGGLSVLANAWREPLSALGR